MPITNIVDRRKKTYRFLKVNAIVEAAWHDNTVEDSDKIILPLSEISPEYIVGVDGMSGPDYEEREHISMEEAIKWASSFSTAVTLYIYDEDSDIYPVHETSTGAVVGQEFPNGEDEMS